MSAYAAGDVVTLVSSPECRMTVAAQTPEGKFVCVWFTQNKELRDAEFPGAMLRPAEIRKQIGFGRKNNAEYKR